MAVIPAYCTWLKHLLPLQRKSQYRAWSCWGASQLQDYTLHPPLLEPEQSVSPGQLKSSTEKGVQEFWSCWTRYFAPNLLLRNKWYKKRKHL
ncbi:hypothetical protein pdam_00025414 [Pocillopora damicornis]|uniref:Uncharacterized protein n=1 Tax=Pocillopora damicornis TaxID=46731 RepID=A0A3M6UST5_POCDA|nr:hypothetical protein pdam_00025414 [Pocillopora damicornis]